MGAAVLGGASTRAGAAGGSAAVSCTAPTVPPTASATPTAAVAAMPAGEENNLRVRRCLAATGPVLSSTQQTGPDRNERSTSDVNVIMVVWPHLLCYV
ncbi:hypothetical protein TPA0908_01650 [Micromonospora sp. AKA38]|nr:hypothetical protein TPA0908_01650 [Micromonospora sp. AKA38]